MTIELPVVISIATSCLSAGFVGGMLTARFQSKKDCEIHRTKIDNKIEGIQNVLTGGKLRFEMKLIESER